MYATNPWGLRGGSGGSSAVGTTTTMTDRSIESCYSYQSYIPTPESSKYDGIHSNFKLLTKDFKLPIETEDEYKELNCCRYDENKYKFNYDLKFFKEALRMLTDGEQRIHLPDILQTVSLKDVMSVNTETIAHIEICRVSLANLDKLQLILIKNNIKGTHIYTKETNGNKIKVATVDKSNITHIHLSILSIYNGEGVELLMKILNKALKIISGKEKSFSLVFEKAIGCNLNKNKTRISDLMKQISNSQKQLEKAKRSYKLLSRLYQNSDTKKDAIRSFEVMKKDKRIQDIKVRNNLIYVFTNNIKIDIKDVNIFDIGKYEIVYNLLDGDVKIFNQRKLGSYQHPHVSPEGNPCWGNISTSIPRLLAKLDLVGLTNLILKFLSSYRDGDAYTNIYNFVGKPVPQGNISSGHIMTGFMSDATT